MRCLILIALSLALASKYFLLSACSTALCCTVPAPVYGNGVAAASIIRLLYKTDAVFELVHCTAVQFCMLSCNACIADCKLHALYYDTVQCMQYLIPAILTAAPAA
jgi:hypothetical protein